MGDQHQWLPVSPSISFRSLIHAFSFFSTVEFTGPRLRRRPTWGRYPQHKQPLGEGEGETKEMWNRGNRCNQAHDEHGVKVTKGPCKTFP